MHLFDVKVKSGKSKNCEKRSIRMWSDQYFLQKELDHLKTVSIKLNDYPAKTVDKIIKNGLQKENIDWDWPYAMK